MPRSESERAGAEGIIQLLDAEVIARIAAGEVIERPASVVKELVENSLDAGARALRVEVRGGGLDALLVADDGQGMSPRDARLALELHATSKLHRAEELYALHTLGFRGEGLSSIAAVSRLTLTTRRSEDATATRVQCAGGEVLATETVGAPPGTTVVARELFYNIPARRKFMKSPATEQAHAKETALRTVLGVGRPIALTIDVDGRRAVDLAPTAELVARVSAVLGDRGRALFPVAGQAGGVRIDGVLAAPGAARRDARALWLFVNGRTVRDRALAHAVADAWRPVLEPGRFPVGAVWLSLDPEVVDVNVHPQKLEVRFADAPRVFQALRATVAQFVASAPWRTGGVAQAADPQKRVELAVESYYSRAQERFASGFARRVAEGGSAAYDAAPQAIDPRWLRCGDYALVEAGEAQICLIDIAAAAREAAVARLGKVQDYPRESRALLLPHVLDLPAPAVAQLEAAEAELEGVGLRLEAVGPGRLALRAAPEPLDELAAESWLRAVRRGLAAAAGGSLGAAILHSACLEVGAPLDPSRFAEAVARALGAESSTTSRSLAPRDLRRLFDER